MEFAGFVAFLRVTRLNLRYIWPSSQMREADFLVMKGSYPTVWYVLEVCLVSSMAYLRRVGFQQPLSIVRKYRTRLQGWYREVEGAT